jgi:hypothetical protein
MHDAREAYAITLVVDQMPPIDVYRRSDPGKGCRTA